MHSVEQELTSINASIEESAQSADWDKTKELTNKRHSLLQNYCEDKSNQLNEKTLLFIQTSINQCDQKIQHIISQQKTKNIQSSLDLRNSYHAVNEYRKTHNTPSNS